MSRSPIVLILFVCLLAAGVPLSGIVTDPSGAAIPALEVSARNEATGAVARTSTDAEGAYAFAALPAGRYTVEVRHAGFTPFTRSGVDATARLGIVLNLETHSDVVTVSESVTQVQTADTQTGATFSASRMTAIPVNGRSFTDLLALQPGVIPTSSQQPNAVVMAGCTATSPSSECTRCSKPSWKRG